VATDPDVLIHGYFDGLLSDEQFDELCAWLSRDQEHARRFAQAALLHDRLRNQFCAAALERDHRQPVPGRLPLVRSRWSRVAFAAAAAAAILAVVLIWQEFHGGSARAAAAELKRLIQVVDRATDRTYLITALDQGDPEPPHAAEQKKRGGAQPPIHGALLYTRGPGQYVLVRRFEDGAEFITGSDGQTSWACPPLKDGKKGNVRVSADPLRFRGPIPGQQHDIPFLDIRTNLDQLRDAYELTLLPARSVGDKGEQWSGIRGERRDPATGGPRQVEIWYLPHSGVIQEMRFDGLPRARGGPRSVRVELIDQHDLGPNFFEHTAHHGPERRVLSADD
jgi:hypothetical protein